MRHAHQPLVWDSTAESLPKVTRRSYAQCVHRIAAAVVLVLTQSQVSAADLMAPCAPAGPPAATAPKTQADRAGAPRTARPRVARVHPTAQVTRPVARVKRVQRPTAPTLAKARVPAPRGERAAAGAPAVKGSVCAAPSQGMPALSSAPAATPIADWMTAASLPTAAPAMVMAPSAQLPPQAAPLEEPSHERASAPTVELPPELAELLEHAGKTVDDLSIGHWTPPAALVDVAAQEPSIPGHDVPEPGALALWSTALLAAWLLRRRSARAR